ncbi:MAG TPA: hypothetical protein H9695_13060 [Candidatus Mediterraneibacter excrementigallinarum]|nr:hypothetical protein [Candidatus Mediterraneibacter excrementigallinarum]
MKRILALILMFMFLLGMPACSQTQQEMPAVGESAGGSAPEEEKKSAAENPGHFNRSFQLVHRGTGGISATGKHYSRFGAE